MQFVFEAIGTHWQIDIYEALEPSRAAALQESILERIAVFDAHYSRFRSDSLVTNMSHTAGVYTLPEDAKLLFDLYQDLYTRTNGLLTPLIGNLIADAGYDAVYTLVQTKELTAPLAWDEAVHYVHPTLTIKQPVLIDVGAAGKGYLIDIVGELMEAEGVMQYCIDAGGDIRYRGSEAIRVGLENPFNTSEVVGVYALHNKSLCGSAGTRRAWGAHNHIFNPSTQESVTDIVATWVVTESTRVADALATCLFLVPASTLADAYNFEYLLIRSDGSFEKSNNFLGEVFG
jgi:thiamine biosynthesis lipoprotein